MKLFNRKYIITLLKKCFTEVSYKLLSLFIMNNKEKIKLPTFLLVSFSLFIVINNNLYAAIEEKQELDQDIKDTKEKDNKELESIKPFKKIEKNFDNFPDSLDDMLVSSKIDDYHFEPFLKRIDFTIDLTSIFQYAINKVFQDETIINPRLGIGILWKKGLYSSLFAGYGYINAKSLHDGSDQIKYNTHGPFWDLGLGYYFEYRYNSMIGIAARYGGSLFTGDIKSLKIENKKLNAHWIKIILDAKSEIFKNSNFFFGTEFGIKFLISKNELHKSLKEYLIPEYGFNSNNIGITFAIYMQYSLPFYKKFISVL